jgi:hypothetical protein
VHWPVRCAITIIWILPAATAVGAQQMRPPIEHAAVVAACAIPAIDTTGWTRLSLRLAPVTLLVPVRFSPLGNASKGRETLSGGPSGGIVTIYTDSVSGPHTSAFVGMNGSRSPPEPIPSESCTITIQDKTLTLYSYQEQSYTHAYVVMASWPLDGTRWLKVEAAVGRRKDQEEMLAVVRSLRPHL